MKLLRSFVVRKYRGLKFDWKSPIYNHFLSVFLYKIYSQMTSKLQVGPFQFVCQNDQVGETASKAHQWPKQDLIKYAAFLNFSKDGISTQEEALSWSFLRKMSLFIQTKNPNQCRIFHKKMMETHATLDLLVSDLRKKIERFEEWYESYLPSLKNVKHCLQRETSNVEKQPTKIKAEEEEKQSKLYQESGYFGEKVKQDLKPTDVDYQEESIRPSKIKTFQRQYKPVRPSFGFESFGEADQSKAVIKQNDFEFFNKRTPSFLEVKKEGPSNQDWMDCHHSLINYLGKLNKLANWANQ